MQLGRAGRALGLIGASLCAAAALSGSASAEEPVPDLGRSVVYEARGWGVSEVVTVEVPFAEGSRIHTRARVRLTNSSFDYIAYYPQQTRFLYPHTSLTPEADQKSSKARLVEPWDERYVTLAVGGVDGLDVNRFDIDLNGLYRVPLDGELLAPPLYAPEVDPEELAIGEGLSCERRESEREGRRVTLTLLCRYTGDAAVLVETSRPTLRVDGGRGLRNRADVQLPWVLGPNERLRIQLEFRLPRRQAEVASEAYQVDWGSTFMLTQLIPLDPVTIQMELDPVATANAR